MQRFAKVGEKQITTAILKDFSEKMLENMAKEFNDRLGGEFC